jgi:GNAT superfamily N-acetyltransferase
MVIVFESKPSEKEIAFLEQQLFRFNCSKVDHYSYENFIFKAISGVDSIIAGIHGQIGSGWLYIASLWVDENHRGNGIGQKLLDVAEKAAVERSCHGAYLYTYSFQSPQFYQKFGYRIFGKLENFCGEHTKYFLKKNLA